MRHQSLPASTGAGQGGEPEVVLDAQALSVAFDGHEVVSQVSLSVKAGEKLALVGESGSGKTVTALSLLRLLPQAQLSGKVLLHGGGQTRDLLQLPERALRGVRGRDVAMIFQEPMTALNPLLSIGAQIAEVVEWHLGLPRRQAWARAVELMQQMGLAQASERAHDFPHQLSGGQRQRAMIAMALACEPRVLIADEPTTALDVTLRMQVLELLGQLQSRLGMAVVLITHDLHLVSHFADRVAVMERGRLVEQGRVQEVFERPQHAYTRRLLASRPQRERAPLGLPQEQPLVQAKALGVNYPGRRRDVAWWRQPQPVSALRGVDMALYAGRTLGIIGESGSGKSTLALATLGLLPHLGELSFGGAQWRHRAKADRALRQRIQVVFQDPFSSLSPRMNVLQTVGEGLTVHRPQWTQAQRQARVLEVLEQVGLTQAQFPGLLNRYPHAFSGGQRQRLALARALAIEPQILVLDEPTSALDVSVQKQVLSLLQQLQRDQGLCYLLITHDVDVVAAMADEVMVIQAGVVVESGPRDDVLYGAKHPYTQALLKASGLAQA